MKRIDGVFTRYSIIDAVRTETGRNPKYLNFERLEDGDLKTEETYIAVQMELFSSARLVSELWGGISSRSILKALDRVDFDFDRLVCDQYTEEEMSYRQLKKNHGIGDSRISKILKANGVPVGNRNTKLQRSKREISLDGGRYDGALREALGQLENSKPHSDSSEIDGWGLFGSKNKKIGELIRVLTLQQGMSLADVENLIQTALQQKNDALEASSKHNKL